MMYDLIPDDVLLHSKKVAEIMFAISNDNKMYVLGLLHDVGKIYGYCNHELQGAEIVRSLGFDFDKEILYHGKANPPYHSNALNLLNAADLSVNSKGCVVGYEKRIADIGERYGFYSKEYINAKILSKEVKELLDIIVVE